ncbi:JM31 [macacine gammaherpesvirus 11]|uniref:JM31 n=2 Tax=macacine gammaherpesvirus 11 TaxID=2560570 RepID=G9JM39_9GAMA|nr:JM31 [Macaca fuscata rhadinovirus]AAT00008.1 JM31 [Macaca fuscata rhadinovirus]AEW87556.1 JM31 [Macaca fuscata rhadinovirus]AEW87726.1 JM31 [Macaca fuscata rhadinovirus]
MSPASGAELLLGVLGARRPRALGQVVRRQDFYTVLNNIRPHYATKVNLRTGGNVRVRWLCRGCVSRRSRGPRHSGVGFCGSGSGVNVSTDGLPVCVQ